MNRFGIVGKKFGGAKQAARRFSAAEVELVERLAGGPVTGGRASTDGRAGSDAGNHSGHVEEGVS
jgi:hypothetical protein